MKSESTKAGTTFLLAVVMLHEFVHLGTTANNINEGRYKVGQGLEQDACDVIINELNANKVAMKRQL